MHARLTMSGLALVVIAGTVLGGTTPASAHHGFTGRYDSSEPLYVTGTVIRATYGYPHGLIHIRPGSPTTAPGDLRALSTTEQDGLGGLEVVTSAAPLDASSAGELTLLLPPPMTTEVAARQDRPEAGDGVGAIVYRECSTDELRVQLLRISAAEHVVRSGIMQNEVRGCSATDDSTPGAQGSSSDATDSTARSAPVSMDAEGAAWSVPLPLVLIAAAIVLGAAVVGLVGLARASAASARPAGGAAEPSRSEREDQP